MAHDVFISYSTKDKLVADGICVNLEAAGVRCWIAPRDIAPGEDWPTAITQAISRSRVMVLVFSAHSNSSDDVSRELMLAADSKLVIIPFKIENIEPEPGKRYYLARTHWLDAINPPTWQQIHTLVDCVKTFIPVRETPPVAEVQPIAPPQVYQPIDKEEHAQTPLPKPAPKKRPAWVRYLWVPASLLLLGLIGWIVFAFVTRTLPVSMLTLARATATETATQIAATAIPIPATLTSMPTPTATQTPTTTDSIAGQWTGYAHHNDDPNSEWKFGVTILAHCEIGQVCGTYSAPQYPCSGNLTLERIDENIFTFSETRTGGLNLCPSHNFEFMHLLSPNQLLVTTGPNPDSISANTSALLTK